MNGSSEAGVYTFKVFIKKGTMIKLKSTCLVLLVCIFYSTLLFTQNLIQDSSLVVEGRIIANEAKLTNGALEGAVFVAGNDSVGQWKSIMKVKDYFVGIGLEGQIEPVSRLHVASGLSNFEPISSHSVLIESNGEASLALRSSYSSFFPTNKIIFERPVDSSGALIALSGDHFIIGQHMYTSLSSSYYSDWLNIELNNGLVGLGRKAIENRLEVAGDASKATAGAWFANSDRRIKKDIEELTDAQIKIMSLHPVSFKYSDEWLVKHPEIEDRRYYNFIAQEYQEVFPNAVKDSGEFLDNDPNGILQVDTYDSQIFMIKAMQELIDANNQLWEELKSVKNELRALNIRLNAEGTGNLKSQ